MRDKLLNEWIKKVLGSSTSIKSITPLKGGISSEIFCIEMTNNKSLVLRQFTNQEWLTKCLDLALHEAMSLECAKKIDIPTPELIAFDEKGIDTGHPTILMTLLRGKVDIEPIMQNKWINDIAKTLNSIHTVDIQMPWNYYTYNKVHELEEPMWTKKPKLWGQAIEILKGEKPKTKYRFIHRDYHPTNILWDNNQVSGVVDWVNSCMGPTGIDVGHCRLNLALLIGVNVADDFLNRYIEIAGNNYEYHPFWDLITLIEFLPGPPKVYRGWVDLNIKHLTNELMIGRIDNYLASIMKRL
ncbi:phosphotransferase family enzyme [Natranaerovirga hydrolytica]|uniref:Phosphotransferase family enzyme n=1 Tax=Natranaerovirga hydrolytica TaxID=680378 RepID=A0A4R1MJ02_9FIRM|nr:aminoglycoside phosphotransferase family protein [Natranaerovirga hydrolytica]TCK92656.1 phosphotransferase family enzyme [Natranaerovirga hydrolytica]